MIFPKTQLKSGFPRTAVAMAPVLLAALALAGCAVGPNFREPASPQVDRFTASALPAELVKALKRFNKTPLP